jgi:anti-anti-sigma factor
MLDIQWGDKGEIILSGRWDASQTAQAEAFFEKVNQPGIVDFSNLEYISSAGLSVLLRVQKRLSDAGGGLKLGNMNRHIAGVFRYAGPNQVFDLGAPP